MAADTFILELLRVAEERAEHIAIDFEGELLSYATLFQRARAVAGELKSRGLKRGERVLLINEEKLTHLICHLGVQIAGGCPSPLNPDFTAPELEYFLQDSDASFAICTPGPAETMDAIIPANSSRCQLLIAGELAATTHAELTTFENAPDDDALMLYTSGTTGQPKGAVHTQRSLLHAVSAIASCWKFTPEDRLFLCLPLFHIHGLSFGCHTALLSGCCIEIRQRFNPRYTLDEMTQASIFYAIPTFYYSFLRQAEFAAKAATWKSIRLFTCGSAPIRAEVLPELEETLGTGLINRYGMSESHVIASLPLDKPSKQGSVGLPLDGIEIEIRHPDRSQAATAEVGDVWVRGPNLFVRYWRKPEATEKSFDEAGWFQTGDLGSLDENGYLTLSGRAKDLVIVNGYNVYPPVVERILNDCPGVRESAVIGLPDPRKGERVAAVIVKDDPELETSTIKAFCRERLIDYQRPSKIVFVDSLPRNTMGKILKRELRDRFAN